MYWVRLDSQILIADGARVNCYREARWFASETA
jgi:hypothetical protein